MPPPKYCTQTLLLFILLPSVPLYATEYQPWSQQNDGITLPLTNTRGDPDRGHELISQRSKGNCLACHRIPINNAEFHGTIGPELTGVGQRLTAAQLRLRVADEKRLNPFTIMPAYYGDPRRLNRVLDEYLDQTILSAQEIEDIVAYLVTLK